MGSASYAEHTNRALASALFPPSLNVPLSHQVNRRPFDVIVTDPPYYDAIPYSDLMDFFYVWFAAH